MNHDFLLFIQTQGGILLVKIGFVAMLLLLGMFLFVVLNQIRAMNRIVTQPDMFPYLQSFVVFLGIVTVALIVVTLVIL